MNKIITKSKKTAIKLVSSFDIGIDKGHGKTAFIGGTQAGSCELYLITYDRIVDANSPNRTWTTDDNTPIWYVDHYCDVQIKELS
jgi:hypothetical protein